jgi:hypothetical protein
MKNLYIKNYIHQIADLDFSSIKDTLGIEVRDQKVVNPFFGDEYSVSKTEIMDESGNRPDYMVCVILSKYLLLCPDAPVVNKEWSALKDSHKMSQFTNLNVFASDAERPIIRSFSRRVDALSAASERLGGKSCELGAFYDVSMEFIALPRIKLLLLFNDGDNEFPATCSLLFQKQAETYLDPESLIMVGIAFTQRLRKQSISRKKG